MSAHTNFKTVSEQLFGCYLDENGYRWTYEPQIEDKRKKPDFLACRDGIEFLCDTKKRSPKTVPSEFRPFDPIKPVRQLIRAGRRKFKEFTERLCILVVYNNGDGDARLYPIEVFGAMLGDPGLTLDFDPESGTCDPHSTQSVFLERGGGMIRHYEPLEPHDSAENLSAVVALTSCRVPNPEFQRASAEEERIERQKKGQDLTAREELDIAYKLVQSMPMNLRETPKVVVCINPFARHPLPDNLFDGPYDERWAIQDGELQQVFAGTELEPEE